MVFFLGGVLIGLVLIGIGLISLFGRRTTQSELTDQATPTLTVKDLEELRTSIANAVGTGGVFQQLVEVNGIVKSSNPLKAELSQQPCVYYKTTVLEEYEENHEDENKSKARRGKRTISGNSMSINFYLEDTTGKVLINPHQAKIDSIQVVNRFEPKEDNSFQSGGTKPIESRRVLGYHYQESLLPVDIKISVRGEAVDTDNQLIIQASSEEGEHFMITCKSEEEVVEEKEKNLKEDFQLGIGFIVFGNLVIILGLVLGSVLR